MRNNCFFILCCLATLMGKAATSIRYTLTFAEPQTHYVNVLMEISDWNKNEIEVRMPVWTPGSYLVREFERHVEQVKASDVSGKTLSINRSAKNGWKVQSNGLNKINIEYKVYAFELLVQTSFIDIDHAFLNGTSVFMFINNHTLVPCSVEVKPFAAWKKISTSLDRVKESNPWLLHAPDYDILVDAPMEIGNHVTVEFMAANVKHELALYGHANYDTTLLKTDIKKIIEAETAIFGEHPCKRYVFIVHNLPSGGGGLEHLNSTVVQASRKGYTPGDAYNGFLSLIAHEYFHLWNVKRLRPKPLGPFDYSNENYTNLLYIAEGFTSYYDDLITRRMNAVTDAGYLSTIAGSITSLTNSQGNYIQPVSEASYDAWIKFYRKNENSTNSTISYYTKGSMIACLLDLYILNATNGEKSLDDVMRGMYNEYYKKQNRGYTDEEFIAMAEKVSNSNLKNFFDKYVYGTDSLPFGKHVAFAGLQLVDLNEKIQTTFLGVAANYKDGKLIVTGVERNSPAWREGINVNDELIAIDNVKLADDLATHVQQKKPGDKISFLITRAGLIRTIPVTLARSTKVNYVFEKIETPTALQKLVYEKWLSESR